MRSLIQIQILILCFLSGCTWSASQQPSVLVIAVESLNSEAFYCSDEEAFKLGLGTLCKEGVRFTHAFTPSIMSQSGFASILTGLYPQDSGVFHNGSQYLSEKFVTVPEFAFQSGYRTSFFSGGPPIWRKSGFDQGFELFEDNLSINFNELYRPVKKNLEMFLKWENETADGRPFFSFIFLPDLQFVNQPTLDNHGQERARSFEGQLHEINESFADLVSEMKRARVWDNTYIILVGLNGRTMPTRSNELQTINLQSDGAQVLLIVKPAQKARDAGLEWAIDANVSLVDVGATLFDILGGQGNISDDSTGLGTSSLMNSLQKPQVNWDRDRFILTQSAWAEWREVGATRYAIRQNNMLFIHDVAPLLYNSLTDRFEIQPIHANDGLVRQSVQVMQKYLDEHGFNKWGGIFPQVIERIKIYPAQLNSIVSREEIKLRLSHLIKARSWDKQLVGWLARIAIEDKDWALLEKLGVEHLYPLWVYVAKRNQANESMAPNDYCWKWLDKNSSLSRSTSACSDQEFIAFADWTKISDVQQKSQFEERFFRIFKYIEIDYQISRLNFQNGLPWDTDISIPGEPRNLELALALPEYKGYRQIIENRVKH